MVIPEKAEIRAVYVHPKAGRQGVGRALLRRLETEAQEQGVTTLHLESSLNAQAFYAAQGYLAQGQGLHRLAGGLEMPCCEMSKVLSST